MIHVSTGSRLHFGLFSLPSDRATPWLNLDGDATIPRRQFGGVGLMIDRPGIELKIEQAEKWHAHGSLAARALDIARNYAAFLGTKSAFHIHVESPAPEHSGLGTGTQLSLAIAMAIDELTGEMDLPLHEKIGAIGRGRRSAIGIHGFLFGGFVIESGKLPGAKLSTMVLRREFPTEWRIILILPQGLQGTHGSQEAFAFDELARHDREDRMTESLCRLVLLGMLPALSETDLATFGEALYDFNRRVGEMFQPMQVGIYSHTRVESIVKALREQGIKGVGQSSWGPAVFAIVNTDEAPVLRDRLIAKNVVAPSEITITWARNRGTQMSA